MAKDRKIVAIVLVPSVYAAIYIRVQVDSVVLDVLSHLLLIQLFVILLDLNEAVVK